MLQEGARQTPLVEFLRYGAAGASGTVTEPFALQPKFPGAFPSGPLCARSSLAEAFYQSIAMPYQLIVVGDPLCQPWARFPVFAVEGLAEGASVAGKVKVKGCQGEDSPVSIQRIEWFFGWPAFSLYQAGRDI